MTETPPFTQTVFPLRDFDPATLPSEEPIYRAYAPGVPICIDLGAHSTKIGLANAAVPNNVFPSIVSRWRDRKISQTLTIVGNDVFRDSSVKLAMKTPFDGPMIANWDYIEYMLDYSFEHLGVNSSGGVDNPVVMTEAMGAPHVFRKNMYQLLFEAYNAPTVAFGLDSLFAYHANGGRTGLVVGAGHELTSIIPVVQGRGILTQAKRINFGGHQATTYLSSLLTLKYPYFPTKITAQQAEYLVHDHCYVSPNFHEEIKTALDPDVLQTLDRVIEAPFVEIAKVVKSEEELQKEAEKRREGGRRLQEQAQKLRLEKLVQKEKDYAYYITVRAKMETASKRDVQNMLQGEGFEGEADFKKYMYNLERSLKRSRQGDLGDVEEETPTFPLVDIPDEQLSEEEIREKRKQRLMKSNYDARARAKLEKEEEKRLRDEEIRKDKEWRESDLDGWVAARRARLGELIAKHQVRVKIQREGKDRKSKASQQRMKNIASLADDADANAGGTKRKRVTNSATIDNDPNDTFGANDADWAVYRDINSEAVGADNEEVEEEEREELLKIERELLEHDVQFTQADTFEASFDWKNSTLHKFLRGPSAFDIEDAHHQHQVHLNVERIRVPEIYFQPSIAGLDQAGVCEISEDIVLRRMPSCGFLGDADEMVRDVFLCGGPVLTHGFETRMRNEFTSFLPSGALLRIRTANDPVLDAWKGMAQWANGAGATYVTKKEYEEMGSEYIKEHNLGNPCLI
ncbi:hypothetical protein BABINDRAFT_159277 [Babjeviella inositovora NRRL Y-12698]|uniref:Actin-related protein 5 n=1 Tax=Babjeviella inositovora NRRL Y-12698 TaxID=984486 RepID=A0A1E3QYY2_9ASCO|nr:uncharacterized protein BABINDRAFT_159277 [Babjeviella inositovora NRRL Y-12698]ODQ82764.1 hypothetical protein BABINDRAFT_159277 [Babjeviella inositovora NRRL Y-12698]